MVNSNLWCTNNSFYTAVPCMWSRCIFNLPDEIFGASILWHLYRYSGILGYCLSDGSIAGTGKVSKSHTHTHTHTHTHKIQFAHSIHHAVLYSIKIFLNSRSLLQMVGAVGVALAVEYDRSGIFTFLIPGAIGILLLVGGWVSWIDLVL